MPVFPDSVVIHDFNFDGRLDLANGVVDSGIQIVRNDGNRTFTAAQLIPEPQGGSVQIADFNYDGIVDLFASGFGGFYIVLANADGTFRTPQFTAVPPLGSGSTALRNRYVWGDFRGLHRVDVATTKFFPAPETIETDLNDCGPPPLLTSVTPGSGPAAGGNSVQLHGDNVFVSPQVFFGTTAATVNTFTATLVTVTAPAHAPGIVPVSITTPDGTATLNDAYVFVGASTTSIVVPPIVVASKPFDVSATIARERIQAQVNADRAALDRIYADDFIGIGPSGTRRTKKDVLSDFASGSLKFQSITTDDVQIRVYGNAAVETGLSTMKGQDAEKVVPEENRFTRVWIRQGGRWRLVANHYSTLVKRH